MTAGDHRQAEKECPFCDWTRSYDPETLASELSAEVDAEIHFDKEHSGLEVPEDAEFGDHQCPKCYDMTGMEGNVSCGNCGFIPGWARA